MWSSRFIFGGTTGGTLLFSRILLRITGNVVGFTLGSSGMGVFFFFRLIRGALKFGFTLPDILSTGISDDDSVLEPLADKGVSLCSSASASMILNSFII